MNARVLYDGNGQRVSLGAQLGRGGEGAVFALPGAANEVAKIYHAAIKADKQAKLRFMAGASDSAMSTYAAWPLRTLHDGPRGSVVGFIMPSVDGRSEVHTFYSPAQRRVDHPTIGWDFLVFVARNTAAAFETLHARHHVLGDVNQGNVMVGTDSRVVLIDCDSFQVRADTTLHRCEVGVPEFTPPELQGITSFASTTRTANHDNFGLALLIFHLLMGGRHPYAGVPLTREAGQSLEGDVRAFRYAYASDALARGNKPPPRSIPITLVPPALRLMFEAAFLPEGATGARPSAAQWRGALDDLRKHLRRCAAAKIHVYPDHLLACPWCELERQGVVYFLSLSARTAFVSPAGFDATKTWATIRAITLPAAPAVPNPSSLTLIPRPLPDGMPNPVFVFGLQVVFILAATGLSFLVPKFMVLFGIAALFGCVRVRHTLGAKRSAERAHRNAAAEVAQRNFDALVARMRHEAASPKFDAMKRDLGNAHDEWQGLAALLKSELDALKVNALERQRDRYLDRFLILSAKIQGVGPTKKAALRSFGIETAADVTITGVRAVPGFGEALTSTMMAWRMTILQNFVFDPRAGVSPSDEAAVRNRIGMRRTTLERNLANGAGELMRLRRDAVARTQALLVQMKAAAQDLAQTRADMTLL